MALQFNFLLFASLLFIASTCFHARSEQPIKPNDPKVVGIAKFAVQERNKEAKTNFKLVKVNAGGTDPIPDGVVYQLYISVTEASVSTTRLVFVLVHKDNTKELLAFE
ncbi:hypothetical protein FXO37_06567 [Capsicum annuum]|nr:hypothetical protein FXO37_06567 [Capsicum annuum]